MPNSHKAQVTPTNLVLAAEHPLLRYQSLSLKVGIAMAAVSVALGLLNAPRFFESYLVAWLFWLGIPAGAMAIVLLNHITGGRWGAVLRRPLEAASLTLPVMAALFIPILVGMKTLYPWSDPQIVAADHILAHKALYLNTPFFLVRAVIFFGAWIVVSRLLSSWSQQQDREGHTTVLGKRLLALSRGGLPLYGLTMTFASIDWGMSIEPHWFSHIYGLIFVGGQVLAALSFGIIVCSSYADQEPFSRVMNEERFHDLGKLLLSFVMVWAYFNFSQYLIVWAGDLPEEVVWFTQRLRGGWQYVAVLMFFANFIFPFMVLLSRGLKRNRNLLSGVALFILAAHFLETFWYVIPAFSPGAFSLHILDFTTAAAVGGIWYWAFAKQIRSTAMLPINEPMIARELNP